jgi:hypothetical protein
MQGAINGDLTTYYNSTHNKLMSHRKHRIILVQKCSNIVLNFVEMLYVNVQILKHLFRPVVDKLEDLDLIHMVEHRDPW